ELPAGPTFVEAEAAAVLDEISAVLRGRRYEPGAIAPAQRTVVLNAVVDYCVATLRAMLATLDPEGLLEGLVLANEALLDRADRNRRTLAIVLACYGGEAAL